jgi:NAD(P)-dependent dehydrogenase (short-subunit alcohol dehydrogenase family)
VTSACVDLTKLSREAVLKQAVGDVMSDPEIDRVLWHLIDPEDGDSVDRLTEFIDSELGELDILVGNAGADASEFIGAITFSSSICGVVATANEGVSDVWRIQGRDGWVRQMRCGRRQLDPGRVSEMPGPAQVGRSS